jgi:tetratricopeptide (TPR) repeat protein
MKKKKKEKTSSGTTSQGCVIYLLAFFCAVVIVVRVAASFSPQGRIWGINQWSYFSPAISLLSGALVLLFFLPRLNDLALKWTSSLGSSLISYLDTVSVFAKRGKYFLYSVLSILFFIPFWLLRDRAHFLGDGSQIISRMNSGELSLTWSEPLESLSHIWIYDLAHRIWPMDSAQVYAIFSCLAGVIFVFLVFILADFWGKEHRERVLIFFVLLSMGSMQLFFGYVEHYTLWYVFIFAFILSSLAYLKGKLGWLVPLLTFILASLSHVSALYLLPSLLYVFVVKENHSRQYRKKKALILGSGLVFLGLILFLYCSQSWTLPPLLVPLLQDRYEAPGYLLFSIPHIIDFLNQQLLISPVGIIMILAPLACWVGAIFLKNKTLVFLLLVSLFQLLTNFLFNPALGASRDWDLSSAVGLGYTMLGLFVLLKLLKDKPKFGYLSLILILTSLHSTVPWIVLNANEQKSIRRFQNLLDIDAKKSANGHFILIKYFESQGMEEQAKRQNQKYLNTFPELTLTLQGAKLVKQGEWERAEELYLRAEKLAPKLAQNHNNLGHLYLSRGELERAEAELKKAVRLSPHLATPYGNLADLYLLRGDYDRALEASRKAIRLKSDHPETYSNAATIYLIRGDLGQAEAHYKKTLDLDPQFVDAYVGLGDIYNRKAMPKEAIAMYQNAVYLNPRLAKAHFRLGMTYLSVGSRERAEKELELYLNISPDGKDAKQVREMLKNLRQ